MKEASSSIRENTVMESEMPTDLLLKRLTLVCIAITAGISWVAIAGWVSGMRLLASISSDYVPLAPGAALGLILLSAALFVYAFMPAHHPGLNLARGATLLVLLFSSTTLIEFFAGIEPGIEQSLFRIYEKVGGIPVVRMSPLAAVNLLLSACSLLLLTSPIGRRRAKGAGSGIAVLVGLIGLITTLGYLYGTPLLYGGTTRPMAFMAAVAFIFLGTGLITAAGQQFWPLSSFMGSTTRARLLRVFLPLVIAIVLLEGWFINVIHRQPDINPALVSSLTAILFAIIFSSVINRAAQSIGGSIDHANAERERAEETLRNALQESQKRQAEISALLEGSRAILELREFQQAARSIFDSCKNLIGATAGYVALLSKDGTENEVLFLDSGGLPCTVDPSLPMPIRGLRGEAYRFSKTVYCNDFPSSEWVEFMPKGHVKLDNVLFAPLLIEKKTVGLIGIANKPGGFNENDARLASAFGDYAAIALLNSRMLESLKRSEERFHSVAQTANDAIVTSDSSGNIVYWNHGAEITFGYSADEIAGKPLTVLMPERFHKAHKNGLQRVVSTGKTSIIGKTIEMSALRKDGSEFPVELSLATWKTMEGIFFTGIVRDITERKKAEEIHLENERLVYANMVRSELLRIMSHELRTPLNTIIGFSELLKQAAGGFSEKQNRYVDNINTGGKHLLAIINNILELAEIETGKMELVFEKFEVIKAIDDVIFLNKKIMAERNIILKKELDPVLDFIEADRKKFMLILFNLLDNAVKFSKEEGETVTITAKKEGDMARFSVSDTGIGIKEEYMGMLFTKFWQVDLSIRRKYGGAGLGLAISKRLVEIHGGSIRAESRYGEGSTFTFILPLKTKKRE